MEFGRGLFFQVFIYCNIILFQSPEYLVLYPSLSDYFDHAVVSGIVLVAKLFVYFRGLLCGRRLVSLVPAGRSSSP